jgi:hypothetical protein
MPKHKDLPAFPIQDNTLLSQKGMELRDYFAAKAMQSYWSDPNVTPELDAAAAWAYEMADAMLKARQE